MIDFVSAVVKLGDKSTLSDDRPMFPSSVSLTYGINTPPVAVVQYPIDPNEPITFDIREQLSVGVNIYGCGGGGTNTKADVIFDGQITDVGYSTTPTAHTQTFVAKGFSDLFRKLYAVQISLSDLSENAYGFGEFATFVGANNTYPTQYMQNAPSILTVGQNLIQEYVLTHDIKDPIRAALEIVLNLLENSVFDDDIKTQLRDRLFAASTPYIEEWYTATATNNAWFKQAAGVNPVAPISQFLLELFGTLNYQIIDIGKKICFVPDLQWASIPKSNIIFQDQILDLKVNFDYADKPSRLRAAVAAMPGKSSTGAFLPPIEAAFYYPPDSAANLVNYRKVVGNENRTGVNPMSMSLGMAELAALRSVGNDFNTVKPSFLTGNDQQASGYSAEEIAVLGSYFSNTSSAQAMASMIQSKFLAARASHSSAQIVTHLQPYLLPGVPTGVLGFVEPFIGIPQQISHIIDSNTKQAVTQITMSNCTNIVDLRVSQPPVLTSLDVDAIYRELGTEKEPSITNLNDFNSLLSQRNSYADPTRWERYYNRRVCDTIDIPDQEFLGGVPNVDVYRS